MNHVYFHTTIAGSFSYDLNFIYESDAGSEGSMTGISRRGFKVSLRTEYFYTEDAPGATYDNVNMLVNEVLLALVASGSNILRLTEGQLIDLASGGNDYSDALGSFFSSSFDTTDVSKPHGYLVWMLYDNDMKLIPAGSGAKRVTDPNELKYLLEENIAVVQDGYLHAYVSNGSASNVSFDNFLITYMRGQTRQINHYYPYGLSIDGLDHSDEYLNKYTTKELQTGEFDPALSSGLEMFDFHARFYDPQIGRWFTPDPAEQFANPYLAMGNNPVRYTDPTGTYVPMRYWGKGDNGVTGFDGGGGNSQGDEFGDVGSINGWSYYHQSNLPSNNSWLIGARSKEYNRQFLSSNGFAAVYGPQQPKYVDQQNRLKFIRKLNAFVEKHSTPIDDSGLLIADTNSSDYLNSQKGSGNGLFLLGSAAYVHDGQHNVDPLIVDFQGGKHVRIIVTNSNYFQGVQLDLVDQSRTTYVDTWWGGKREEFSGDKYSFLLLMGQSKQFDFYRFDYTPMAWRFQLSTLISIANVEIKFYSNWIPGMPSDRPNFKP